MIQGTLLLLVRRFRGFLSCVGVKPSAFFLEFSPHVPEAFGFRPLQVVLVFAFRVGAWTLCFFLVLPDLSDFLFIGGFPAISLPFVSLLLSFFFLEAFLPRVPVDVGSVGTCSCAHRLLLLTCVVVIADADEGVVDDVVVLWFLLGDALKGVFEDLAFLLGDAVDGVVMILLRDVFEGVDDDLVFLLRDAVEGAVDDVDWALLVGSESVVGVLLVDETIAVVCGVDRVLSLCRNCGEASMPLCKFTGTPARSI